MTAPTYVLLGLSLLTRILVSRRAETRDDCSDAIPLVVCILLSVAGVIHRGDPIYVYGLTVSSFLNCPWPAVFLLWIVAFSAGRVANALMLRPDSDFRKLVATGQASPGGVYLSLKGYPRYAGMILALPMIWSQAFMEEFVFRGLLVSLGRGLLGFLKVSIGLVDSLSIAVTSVLFGLVHFLPMHSCMRGKNTWIPLYALIMPTTLGVLFSILNGASGSLWPGWIVHCSLNYAVFVWDRVSGMWEACSTG